MLFVSYSLSCLSNSFPSLFLSIYFSQSLSFSLQYLTVFVPVFLSTSLSLSLYFSLLLSLCPCLSLYLSVFVPVSLSISLSLSLSLNLSLILCVSWHVFILLVDGYSHNMEGCMAVMLVCLFVCMLQSEKEREREWGGDTNPLLPCTDRKKRFKQRWRHLFEFTECIMKVLLRAGNL